MQANSNQFTTRPHMSLLYARRLRDWLLDSGAYRLRYVKIFLSLFKSKRAKKATYNAVYI